MAKSKPSPARILTNQRLYQFKITLRASTL